MNSSSKFAQNVAFLLRRFSFHNALISRVLSDITLILSPKGTPRRQAIDEFLEEYSNVSARSGMSRNALVRDLYFSKWYYAIRDKDYFNFELDLSKGPDKLSYIGWQELKYYYTKLAEIGSMELFDRKDKTYLAYSPFFRRELRYIASESEESSFLQFFEQHKSCIIKPVDTYGGNGIQILSLSNQTSAKSIWEMVREFCPFVMEELIEQADEMKAFYPKSVNTIRYTTFFHNGNLTRMQATLRVGRGGNVVDNITQGGIFAPVDPDSGKILGPARSFHCEVFPKHSDTGTQFEGNTIPHWDELNDLVEKVVRVTPEQKLIGWDFALSTRGWVMVEANWNPGLQSFDPEHGLRKLVSETIGSVVPMWDRNQK